MYKVVTLLILASRIPNEVRTLRACIPNTQLVVNGQICICDNRGYIDPAHCKAIRQSCQPGKIVRQGCNQCICQNGYLLCSNFHCDSLGKVQVQRQGVPTFGPRCTPFRTYYVNCTICACTASGKTSDARCVRDTSCQEHSGAGTTSTTLANTRCIPHVMYLYPCTQCLCSDRGYFDPKLCVDQCEPSSSNGRCVPGALFRIGCKLCRCPDSSVPDEKLCVNANCIQQFKENTHSVSRTDSKGCVPYSFTAPRCMYCDCNSAGTVNEKVCLELDCTRAKEFSKQRNVRSTCIPGEMVLICLECFCTRRGETIAKYCSRDCSNQSKMDILEKILSETTSDIIERNDITRIIDNERCAPNFLYFNDGKYCLCPQNGNVDTKLCTSYTEQSNPIDNHEINSNKIVDTSTPCEPNTFVQFDCNTCYCNRNGTIDPKWCTYDDCEAKRIVQESHKSYISDVVIDKASGSCYPGSISKLECNFCICPENGILKEKACTQNDCTAVDHSVYNDNLTCEPSAYYEVDCNICYCPQDGIKYVTKCTKNQCEKSARKSDSCDPGQLFSDECNVCVCPPDGNKEGKACTNHVCRQIPSLKHLTLPTSTKDILNSTTRSLDHCSPGEEFIDGCNLCICPELGLKMYATCETVLCDDKLSNLRHRKRNFTGFLTIKSPTRSKFVNPLPRRSADDCFSYNVSLSAERKECTPGTMYIIRCKQCICPYLGSINNFCRPLPKNMYCEQAFPYYNYLPMGRRHLNVNQTKTDHTKMIHDDTEKKTPSLERNIEIKVNHTHTRYDCAKPGTIIDTCFICDCAEGAVVEEHCFRSDAANCTDAKPSFLVGNKVVL